MMVALTNKAHDQETMKQFVLPVKLLGRPKVMDSTKVIGERRCFCLVEGLMAAVYGGFEELSMATLEVVSW